MGFGKFWKFIRTNNAIFQDLEDFGREVFQNGYGKVLDFCFKKTAKEPMLLTIDILFHLVLLANYS